MRKGQEYPVEGEPTFPEVEMPGFITLRFGNGNAVKLIIAEESRAALQRLFEWQLWHAAAPPLGMVDVEDSQGYRWYWQSR